MDSWKPIRTAPKTGVAILACGSYEGRRDLALHPQTVRWGIFDTVTCRSGYWINHLGVEEESLTHWMELPECPSRAEWQGDQSHDMVGKCVYVMCPEHILHGKPGRVIGVHEGGDGYGGDVLVIRMTDGSYILGNRDEWLEILGG